MFRLGLGLVLELSGLGLGLGSELRQGPVVPCPLQEVIEDEAAARRAVVREHAAAVGRAKLRLGALNEATQVRR